MSRIVGIINNILAECLNYFFVATIIAVYYFVSFKEWPVIWKLVLLVAFPIWLYFLREKCRWALLFFAGHILPILIIVGTYGEVFMQRLCVAVLLCIFSGISIKQRFTGRKMGMMAVYIPVVVGAYVLLYILDATVGEGKTFAYLINATFLYCGGYFIYTYFEGFERYVEINQKSAEHIPEKKAFQMSFTMAGVFTGGILLLISRLADRELIDALSIAFRDFLLNLIRALVALIKWEKQPAYQMPVEERTRMEDILSGEMQKESLLGKVLLAIVSTVIVILLVVFVAAAIVALIKIIRDTFLSGKSGDQKRFIQEQETDKVEFLFKKGRQKAGKRDEAESDFENTYSRQIRKIYEKTLWQKYKVLKEEKTGKLLKGATARECCLQIFKGQEEEAICFAQLYEKARYAKGKCERTHVKEMKRYADILLNK